MHDPDRTEAERIHSIQKVRNTRDAKMHVEERFDEIPAKV